LFTIPIILSFIFIVTGGLTGRYFALVDTFLAIMIAGLTMHLNNGKALKYATYTLILFFGGIFIVKALYVSASASLRNPYINEAAITKYIKPNNAIAADFACILTVTHIPHLKEAFQTRIEVNKTEQGSQIRLSA
jgi:hypothetical protein